MRQKSVKKGSIISALIITGFVALILTALMLSSNVIFNAELPMMQLAYLTNNVLGSMYSVILWLAIMTSVVISGYMLTQSLDSVIKNDWICVSVILVLSFSFSRLGFGNIVTVFYPIKGAIGLIYLLAFTIYYFTHRKQIKQIN
jgi:uncharacterized membrane protein YkvI